MTLSIWVCYLWLVKSTNQHVDDTCLYSFPKLFLVAPTARNIDFFFFYVIYDLTGNYSYLSHYMTYNSHFHNLLYFTFTFTLNVILWLLLYIIYHHQKRSYPHLPLIGGQHLYWVALVGTSSAVKLKKKIHQIYGFKNVMMIINIS